MTSLVSWVGVDQRRPASLYIATDSRISWGHSSVWDMGRKVFASRRRPEVYGYVGDVLFPSLILGQIADIPENPSPDENLSPEVRFDKIRRLIGNAFKTLPASEQRPFRIGYGVRLGFGMNASFHFFSLSWDNRTGWSSNKENLPIASDSIVMWGSGAPVVLRWKDRWNSSSQRSTSRAIFSSFCDAIGSGSDPISGGSPQLVGMYRIGLARSIGVVSNGRPHIFGIEVDPANSAKSDLEWRNRFFERCDQYGNLFPKAKAHYVPKGLGSSGLS